MKMAAPTTRYEIVTRADATRFLAEAGQNRSLCAAAVRTHAHEMSAGHWLPAPQGIVFHGGQLRNGQTRLSALLASGVDHLEMEVTYIESDALKEERSKNELIEITVPNGEAILAVIDGGRTRTIKHYASFTSGACAHTSTAAAVRVLADAVSMVIGAHHTLRLALVAERLMEGVISRAQRRGYPACVRGALLGGLLSGAVPAWAVAETHRQLVQGVATSAAMQRLMSRITVAQGGVSRSSREPLTLLAARALEIARDGTDVRNLRPMDADRFRSAYAFPAMARLMKETD